MLDTYRSLATRRNLGILGIATLSFLGLYFVGGVGATNAPSQQEATQFCEERCSQIQETQGQIQDSEMYAYCKDTFEIDSGAPISGPDLKEGDTEYCTNGAKCANLHACQVGEITLDMQGCIQFMTRYHEEQQDENPEDARQRTEDLLSEENEEKGVGTCEPKPGWYSEVTS